MAKAIRLIDQSDIELGGDRRQNVSLEKSTS